MLDEVLEKERINNEKNIIIQEIEGTPYKDRQYIDGSQIAYLTFLNRAREELGERDTPYTIAELVSHQIDIEEARRTRSLMNPNKNKEKEDPIDELKDLIKYSKEINEGQKSTLLNISNDSYHWKFIDCLDKNCKTGFYACVLDTNPNKEETGNLMIAFRGSESFKSRQNIMNDWLKADLGLLIGKTRQQKDVEEFIDYLSTNKAFEKYKEKQIDVTGHSLGGNLATHFTLYSFMKNLDICNRIHKCYNLDGPGYIGVELASYGFYRKLTRSKIVHLIASPIGNLLKNPAEEVRYVHIREDIEESNKKNPFKWHFIKNWALDEEGNIIEEKNRNRVIEEFGNRSKKLTGNETQHFLNGILNFYPKWLLEGKEKIDADLIDKILITLVGNTLLAKLFPKVALISMATIIITTIMYLKRKKQEENEIIQSQNLEDMLTYDESKLILECERKYE